ncbi:hypothetical protein YB2330_000208 [Saitoella coloradoensis]
MDKNEVEHLENAQRDPLADHLKDSAIYRVDADDAASVLITPEAEKALLRKIDRWIIPFLGMSYAWQYVDKTTLSYAALFGIREDTHLKGTEYSWLSALFYFGYMFAEYPTNYFLQRFPVGKYLGVNVVLWGGTLMCLAACHNFITLAVVRVILGAFEACATPSFMLLTGMFYRRSEQPVRIGLWYTCNGVAIAFGGLFAYAIGHIQGSLASWRYLFLIIGAITVLWGIILILFLADSPMKAKWLTPEERALAVARLAEENLGVENKEFKMYQVKEAITDPKTYLFFLFALSSNIPNGGLSNFGSLIIKGFGYDKLATTLLQIPYGTGIALAIVSCVYINDRLLPPNSRCWIMVAYLIPNVVGSLGLYLIPQEHKIPLLICYYLTGFYNATFVVGLSFITGNVAGHTKKVIVQAFLFVGYSVGNIAGPFFYKTSEAPKYTMGIISMLASYCLEIAVILCLRFVFGRENAKKDRAMRHFEPGTKEAIEQEEDRMRLVFNDETDLKNPYFRYVM